MLLLLVTNGSFMIAEQFVAGGIGKLFDGNSSAVWFGNVERGAKGAF